ncbi:ABC transporter ATP-binding protein [Modestobacter sp. VKM Ac-2977]|uniref:ABC transporter ATP-binding protein n=1 Tax=Modestobacter sp. VKM Ac-2977 TaxID=3004131 RepID=UPI0022AA3336|nr:ABC transporter ATP-binding protein [Modestobacter sp. VKM Ac-2977]MCZ2822330.1 ABC transporter ATP-binding protein [Modestobacter sp. VKM Ac-2977]
MTTYRSDEVAEQVTTAAEPDVAISVRDVTKKFRLHNDRKTNLKELFSGRERHPRSEEFWALKGVTLDIPRGKTYGLIGHNGSGKSTLLKLVAGIHRPSSGSITANGRVSAMLELGAGFHPEMSGRDNIYLNGSILGMTRKQIDAAMDRIIEFSGLEEFIDTPVKVYSSGMYVRLGFAIAVNLEPEILIIDEVIAVGDEAFQRRCFDHLYELRRKGVTIVLVTHSLGLVADLCDEAAWLDGGNLRRVGPAREVVDDYLAAVNEREAAAAAKAEAAARAEAAATGAPTVAEPTAEMEGSTPRRGSGEIRVTGVEYLDSEGVERPFLSTGHPGTVRVSYEAAVDLPEVTFGLAFVHESGVQAAGPNSGYGPDTLAIPAGRGAVDFAVDAVALQPGEFLLSVAIVDRGHTYDHLDRAFVLKVRAEEAVTEPGLVRMPGRWTLNVAAPTVEH